jgi:D-amino-acid dehydrogenase
MVSRPGRASGHGVDRQPLPAMKPVLPMAARFRCRMPSPGPIRMFCRRSCKWMGCEDAPLLWRWRADPAQLAWGLRFLRECLPGRTRDNISAIVAMALYSRGRLRALRRRTRAAVRPARARHPAHLYRQQGILGGNRGCSGHASLRLGPRYGRRRQAACKSNRHWPMPGTCWSAATTRVPTNRATPTNSPVALAEHARSRVSIFASAMTVERIANGGSKIAGVVRAVKTAPNC